MKNQEIEPVPKKSHSQHKKSISQVFHCSIVSCIGKTLSVEHIQVEKAILTSARDICATKH